jgi:transcriptional regulator with XRE-family HTH domain
MTNVLQTIGATIRRRRKALSLTQTELGRMTGVPRTVISSLERNAYMELGVRKIDRVAMALGLELCLREASPLSTPDELLQGVK